MKTPQEPAEEYAEKWNEGEPGDPDVAYTSFLAGYSVAMEQKWISVEDQLPELRQNVLCFQPEKQFTSGESTKQRVLIGYLFELQSGERDGFIDLHLLGDKQSYLGNGGKFWAFPYICHQNFVTHWQPLPSPPSQKENNLKTK